MLVAAGFFSLILLLWHPIDFIPLRVLLFILAFFTIQFTTVFLHELGHLIVAILFRLLPATLVIGSGAQLAEYKIGKIGFRFCSSTNEGRVIPSYETCRPSKFLLVALFAAGPIADIIVLFIVAKLLFFPDNSLREHSLFESQIRPLLPLAVIYIFYYQLVYLLDRKSYTDGDYTDARGIADALTFFPAPPPVEEAMQRLYKQFFNCEVFVPEPLPTDSEDLQTYTQWALSLPRTTPQEAGEIKDLFITATILYGWTANLPLADIFSGELLTANPEVITYKGSRGAVLVDLGKFEEGKSLLQEVFAKIRKQCRSRHLRRLPRHRRTPPRQHRICRAMACRCEHNRFLFTRAQTGTQHDSFLNSFSCLCELCGSLPLQTSVKPGLQFPPLLLKLTQPA